MDTSPLEVLPLITPKTVGSFLVIEGHDYSGKSTQIKRLKTLVESLGLSDRVVFTREPGGTPEAEMIRNLVLHQDLHPKTDLLLMMAARVEHNRNLIIPTLNAGKLVISDRYYHSTEAYQVAQHDLSGPYYNLTMATYGDVRVPNLTLVLLIDDDTYLARRKLRGIDNKMDDISEELRKKTRDAYIRIAREKPNTIAIDATGTEEETWDRILGYIQPYLNYLPQG